MRLEAINLGRRETIRLGSRTLDTGIDKRPVDRATIGLLGVEGDVVADTKHHGGPDQAVYLYSRADYDWWQEELGRELPSGTFGENLTVSDFGPEELRPGDRVRIGAVLLELTSPRIPCSVFAQHLAEPRWVKRFATAERPGPYARVLEPGEVAVGDSVELTGGGAATTLLDHFRLYYDNEASAASLERALAAPVSIRERLSIEKRLARTA
ncbi:MAG TPA: MOSC domain-containing protein [Plantibacter sp.]|uniref:MOSC domain-containing protein n=1 Tax=Plantibacter sp. TaxID=1871045 RepID=UPI002CF63E0C|nr:MOSC domain-containing protein [Plantibacter sp.]